ncbi:hypothetical protein BU15DRAFT_61966 [Melanogaster broomeanus]|nr:hypothetical protein BU15DRAFT_61966 [Melanogaster broomeanus]
MSRIMTDPTSSHDAPEPNKGSHRAEQMMLTTTTAAPTPAPRARGDPSSISDSQKELARKADPNGGNCLIANSDGDITEACHILARSTANTKLDKLERVWGMKKGDLNVDSRFNLVFLRSDWRKRFDAGGWFLMPDDKILCNLERTYMSRRHPWSLSVHPLWTSLQDAATT